MCPGEPQLVLTLHMQKLEKAGIYPASIAAPLKKKKTEKQLKLRFIFSQSLSLFPACDLRGLFRTYCREWDSVTPLLTFHTRACMCFFDLLVLSAVIGANSRLAHQFLLVLQLGLQMCTPVSGFYGGPWA